MNIYVFAHGESIGAIGNIVGKAEQVEILIRLSNCVNCDPSETDNLKTRTNIWFYIDLSIVDAAESFQLISGIRIMNAIRNIFRFAV